MTDLEQSFDTLQENVNADPALVQEARDRRGVFADALGSEPDVEDILFIGSLLAVARSSQSRTSTWQSSTAEAIIRVGARPASQQLTLSNARASRSSDCSALRAATRLTSYDWRGRETIRSNASSTIPRTKTPSPLTSYPHFATTRHTPHTGNRFSRLGPHPSRAPESMRQKPERRMALLRPARPRREALES